MNIISASRRTDIPAFFSKKFFESMRRGYYSFVAPYNKETIKVSLKTKDVSCFVFWSKNYGPFTKYLDEFDSYGIPAYFHYTITNYHKFYEKNVPPVDSLVKYAKILSERYGRQCVRWRYDPIFYTEKIDADSHWDNFRYLVDRLAEYTDSCYISAVDFYGKIEKNPLVRKKFKKTIYNGDGTLCSSFLDLAAKMAELCKENDIVLNSCCEKELLKLGIKKASCVDGDLIRKIVGDSKKLEIKKGGTRDGCGCCKSIDIGEYGTCLMGCIYCYAS